MIMIVISLVGTRLKKLPIFASIPVDVFNEYGLAKPSKS